MSAKYYRVIKENFLWDVGAILEFHSEYFNHGGYRAIHSMFAVQEAEDEDEWITAANVEKNADFFERVYKVNLATQVVYETKEKAKELIQSLYKTK